LLKPVFFLLQKAEYKVEWDRETLAHGLPDFAVEVEPKLQISLRFSSAIPPKLGLPREQSRIRDVWPLETHWFVLHILPNYNIHRVFFHGKLPMLRTATSSSLIVLQLGYT
jgi:hypothetical protein